MSFTICVSEDATQYLRNNEIKICAVLENNQLVDDCITSGRVDADPGRTNNNLDS